MSIEQARTCKKCQRANRREDKFCARCGADLAAGLTAALFIITPILLVSSIDPAESDLAFGLPYIAAFLLITFLMAVYTVGTVIVSAVVRRRNRSTARGILVGVGAGLLLGAASCTASFAVF